MEHPMMIGEVANEAVAAQERLHEAIRELRRREMSLRAIAKLVGMSHETVRRICSR